MSHILLTGDAEDQLSELPGNLFQCCITSPPYWGLRNYKVDGQIGLEESPEQYIRSLMRVFREVYRVLREDGTFWLNLGDSYGRDAGKGQHKPGDSGKQAYIYDNGGGRASATADIYSLGLKPKELVGIPWRVAFALSHQKLRTRFPILQIRKLLLQRRSRTRRRNMQPETWPSSTCRS